MLVPILGWPRPGPELNQPKGGYICRYMKPCSSHGTTSRSSRSTPSPTPSTAQLEADGGAVKKREYWGLRSLAYRIKKNRKGHYMLLGLDAQPPASSKWNASSA